MREVTRQIGKLLLLQTSRRQLHVLIVRGMHFGAFVPTSFVDFQVSFRYLDELDNACCCLHVG